MREHGERPPGFIAGVLLAAIVVLLGLALLGCTSRKHRRPPGWAPDAEWVPIPPSGMITVHCSSGAHQLEVRTVRGTLQIRRIPANDTDGPRRRPVTAQCAVLHIDD